MKNKIHLLVLAFIFLTFSSNLYSQLTSDTLGCLPMVARFKSPDQNITGIFWNFGDGASSEKLNPTHVFVDTGTFKIELFSNDIKLHEQTIKILPEVKIDFNIDINKGCAPTAILFTNNTQRPKEINSISYFWDFGDGTSSSSTNPSHTYIDEGQFSITLNVTTNIELCNNSRTIENMINISGKLDVRFRIDSIVPECDNPSTVFFTNQGTVNNNYKYKWDFGDGDTSSFYGIKSHTYNSAGTKIIKLTVDNNNGCVASFSRTIGLVSKETIFDLTYPDTVCDGQFIPFVNNSIDGKYLWTFGADASQAESTLKEPENIHFNTPGFHFFNLKIEAGNCIIDSTFKIFLYIPNADFIIVPDVVCADTISISFIAKDTTHRAYYWNGVEDSWFHIHNDTIKTRDSFYYNYPDFFINRLRVVSQQGCANIYDEYYSVNKPDAQFFVSQHYGLKPLEVIVKDTSLSVDTIIEWIFTWGDGTQSVYDRNTIHLAKHTYLQSGQYYINLRIKTKNGCFDDYYGAIIDVGEPIEEIQNPIEILGNTTNVFCFGDTIKLKAINFPSDIDAFKFHIDNSIFNCEEESNISYAIVDKPGVYQTSIELERDGVFKTLKGQIITVKGAKANIAYNTHCGVNKYKVDFRDSSFNATNIVWKIEGNIFTDKSFIYDFKKAGDYQVILTAENEIDGCPSHSDTVTIYLRDVKAVIDMKDTWCSNDLINFNAKGSENVYASCSKGYVWFFPESENQRPLLTGKETFYTKLPGGEYKIGLSVEDINGCKDTAYHRITNINIDAKFSMDRDEVCIPVKVNFKDESVHDADIVQWNWSFDSNKNEPNPSHVFTIIEKDTFNIQLTVLDTHGCFDSTSQQVITYYPSLEIISDSVICEVNSLDLIATDFTEKGSSLGYYWDIDGVGIFTTQEVSLDNLIPGSYTIKVRGTEKSTGCYADAKTEVIVIKKPEAIIEELSDSVFCFPQTLSVKSISQVDTFDTPIYSWNFGNGRASSREEPVITYGKGEYRMRLIVRSKYGCNDTAFQDVKLIGPEGKISADKNIVCKNEEITFTLFGAKDVSSYFWDFGQGEIGENQSPVKYKYNFLPPSGKTFASVVLQSEESGCETILTLPIEIKKVSADFEDVTSCDPYIDFVNMSIGADNYNWRFANLSTSTIENPQYTFPNAGTYNVKLKIENNTLRCKDSIEKVVTIFLKPIIDVPSEITYCSEDDYQLIFDSDYILSFLPDDIITQSNDSIYILKVENDEQLTINVKNEFGCESSKVIDVNFNENVNQDTTLELYSCLNGKVVIPVLLNRGDNIQWVSVENISIDSLSCTECSNPILSYHDNGILSATITGENCEVRKFTFNISEVKAEVPNVFSPNNDENNDIFRPVVIPASQQENMVINTMKIYSRWGNEIFSASNTNEGWKGNHANNPAVEEVYFFNVNYTLGGGCVFNQKGNVTLVR